MRRSRLLLTTQRKSSHSFETQKQNLTPIALERANRLVLLQTKLEKSHRETDLLGGRGASLRDVSGEQICWAKTKAALTTLCSRLGYLAPFQRFHPHLGLLAGEGGHAAPTKRLKAIVVPVPSST